MSDFVDMHCDGYDRLVVDGYCGKDEGVEDDT